jgi:acyl-CoA synthetase (AMP-forming)/AMP-acid ligase II
VDRVPEHWLGLGFLTSSPFATTSGSLLVCGPLRGGLSGWYLPRFDPEKWITTVEHDRPVAGFLVPAMVELIVGSPRFGTAELSSLAVVNVGSAPIATTTLRRFGEGLGRAEVLCGYGMTEFGAVTAVPLGDGGRHLGSVGLPLPGVVVQIVGPGGEELPVGEAGQVAIGGARRTRSYLDDEDGTARTWAEGWLLSGDLGYVDDDGHLWIVGRQKEMIIRGGHNIVPAEVEAALFEHPAVAEAAVAGVPHDVLGEDVMAWVVLREPVEPEVLRGFLLERLADYKVPRRITMLDALPRNESGKVLKTHLVQRAEPRSAP